MLWQYLVALSCLCEMLLLLLLQCRLTSLVANDVILVDLLIDFNDTTHLSK